MFLLRYKKTPKQSMILCEILVAEFGPWLTGFFSWNFFFLDHFRIIENIISFVWVIRTSKSDINLEIKIRPKQYKIR